MRRLCNGRIVVGLKCCRFNILFVTRGGVNLLLMPVNNLFAIEDSKVSVS